jgi:folate-binding Fe-S cluster repair protein YgfZ
MITLACTTEKNIGTPNQLNNAIEQSSTEKLPYFELITADGKITSDQFLVDSKPEFLLFISPN